MTKQTPRHSTPAQIFRAVRQLNPLEAIYEANKAFRIMLVAKDEDQITEMKQILLGYKLDGVEQCESNTHITIHILSDDQKIPDLHGIDILLVYPDANIETQAWQCTSYIFLPESPEETIHQMLSTGKGKELRLALGAQFPGLRSEAAKTIIHDISLENAIFAITTALGSVIPTVLQPILGVAEGIGDIVILTSNQIRMMFMIGAIYRQNVGFVPQWKELASIIGSAFGWRAIARELVGLIPFGGGLVPKGAVAYAGTTAIGEGLVFFYKTGRHMTRNETAAAFKKAYSESVELVRSLVGRFCPSSDAGKEDGSNAG